MLALLGLLAFGATAAQGAGSLPAALRVVDLNGETLAEHTQYTATTTIQTDPAAICFGSGTGGSGNRVRVPGPTALGVVRDASTEVAGALRPLSVTDHFSFGLGVCGIGGFEAHGSSFWYLKLNHRGSQIGGGKLRLHGGDRVLWYLAPTFPPPPELLLTGAPARVRPGQPFTVRVFAYDDAGHKSPVGGAKVTGADLPTGADGRTEVALQRSAAIKNKLQATHGNDIPSNRIAVCVSRVLSRCPGRHHRQVVGSRGADAISGSKLIDKVRARAGADRVNLRGGGPDVVDCGTGRDIAVLDASDRAADSCERIERD